MRALTVAGLRTLRLHGAMGAGYVAANAVSHPETLGYPLTHLAPFPLEGHAGLTAGALAVTAHVLLRRSDVSVAAPAGSDT